jgi:glycosyltransferase involved in cell wall biosynthesis
MKVLLSAFQCDQNGVSEAYLGYRWYDGMKKYCDITLLTGSKGNNSSAISPSGQWHFKNKYLNKINSAVKLDYFWFDRKSFSELEKDVSEYDILHHVSPVAPRYPVSISKFSKRFILGPVAGGLRVPDKFIHEVEGSEDFFVKLRKFDKFRFKYDKLLISTYERADNILISGEYLLDVLPEKYHSKCIKMMDVGIDTNQYKFTTRDLEASCLRLLYVGRVVPYKGLIYLLRAISYLPENIRKNLRLDIAGNQGASEYENECRRFVVSNNLEQNIKFHGFIPKISVEFLYEKAHVFCFPSLAEAGGTVVLEAMAKGLPVLSVNYGGPSESVDGTSGILVEPLSPEQLVEGFRFNIEHLFHDRACIERLGYGARIRAETHFDWKIRCEKMMDIYKK